jgi:hypothetical protein
MRSQKGREKRRKVSVLTMSHRLENPPSRRLACSRCGTEFTCGLSGPCWCAEEVARLPMPLDGEDCLCRDCLRKAAGEVSESPQSQA